MIRANDPSVCTCRSERVVKSGSTGDRFTEVLCLDTGVDIQSLDGDDIVEGTVECRELNLSPTMYSYQSRLSMRV